ncbi:MAG: ATP-binding protein [Streptosporangiaceae bacterium]|jgi:anti-sigma regulatory factor (Ser/Thr protein kinase)
MTTNDPAADGAHGSGPAEGAVIADAEAGWPGSVPPLLDQAFDAGTLYALRASVQAHATALGLPEARTDDLVIAVHELAANAVRHGAGGGRVRVSEHAGELRCQVEDGGPPARDGDAMPAPAGNSADSWPFSPGHGLWLVRLVADEISVFSGPDGTCATVVFALPGAGAPSAGAY